MADLVAVPKIQVEAASFGEGCSADEIDVETRVPTQSQVEVEEGMSTCELDTVVAVVGRAVCS